MVPGIVVPTILVKDMDRTIDFYCAVAGYQVLVKDEIRTVLGSALVAQPALCLIDEMSQMVPRAARGMAAGCYLSIIVSDVEASFAAVEERKVEVIEAPHGSPDALRAIVRDPNGLVVDIASAKGYAVELPRKRHA